MFFWDTVYKHVLASVSVLYQLQLETRVPIHAWCIHHSFSEEMRVSCEQGLKKTASMKTQLQT